MSIISLGSDHAGFKLKNQIISFLGQHNYTILNLGTDCEDPVDYPDIANKVAYSIIEKKADLGILLCGSGIGMTIAANRFKEIRAALCYNIDMVNLSRKHNGANILVLGSRFISFEESKLLTIEFINTKFEGGRHNQRIKKLS